MGSSGSHATAGTLRFYSFLHPPQAGLVLSAALAAGLEVGAFSPARVLAKQLLEVARLPFTWKVKEVQDCIGIPP